MDKYITTPLTEKIISELDAGDSVYITGVIYTARDAAHKRLYESILKGEDIPIDLENNTLYYLGPTPNKEDQVIGSAGPTTSSRMDKYTPLLMDKGLKGMIGKGKRNEDVIGSIIKNNGVYFAAVGGAGALLSKKIISSKVIAYDDLGTEAIRELYVKEFPVIVVIDSKGNNLYETAVNEYLSRKNNNQL
ncbi:MAG: Fe-S-containing hydro-lyase [Anaerocolumna sp.]